MLQAARYWADVCQHVDRPDFATDPRFADQAGIDANVEAAVAMLREAIGAQPLAHWTERFATLSGPWAPVQDTVQLASDAQIRSNGFIGTVTADDGSQYELVVNPVQFDEHPADLRRAPLFAEHTDQVLEGLGLDWDRILELKVEGTVT